MIPVADAKRISAIVPAYNEESRIGMTLGALKGLGLIDEIVVVDDASKDNTAGIARAHQVVVYTLPENCGKGGALTWGAARVSGDIIALLDADLGETAAEAEKLIRPVLAGEADMTIARFPPARRKGGFGLVKGLAGRGIKMLGGLEAHSPLSGQRAMTREVMERVLPFASGYGVEVGLTVRVARMGYRITEVPVNMTHNETGRDLKGFLHRGRQFWHVARELVTAALKK
ncbi:MAG: glycosyltransferase family 2 protein [Bacillota bacterium]